MSGRGKGKVGLGKGGARRHRKVLRDNIQGITKPAIRRLARRGGVKRISGLIYEETRGDLKVFLENVIRDTITYTVHARRRTVTALDVVSALKGQGRTMYGFGDANNLSGPVKKKKKVQKKDEDEESDEESDEEPDQLEPPALGDLQNLQNIVANHAAGFSVQELSGHRLKDRLDEWMKLVKPVMTFCTDFDKAAFKNAVLNNNMKSPRIYTIVDNKQKGSAFMILKRDDDNTAAVEYICSSRGVTPPGLMTALVQQLNTVEPKVRIQVVITEEAMMFWFKMGFRTKNKNVNKLLTEYRTARTNNKGKSRRNAVPSAFNRDKILQFFQKDDGIQIQNLVLMTYPDIPDQSD